MPPKNTPTSDLIARARAADLADYFRRSSYTLKPQGNEIYIKEIPGLCVNPQKGTWFSHYTGEGGYNPIDCLTKVCGRDFKQAVNELTGQDLDYLRQNSPRKTAPYQAKTAPQGANFSQQNIASPQAKTASQNAGFSAQNIAQTAQQNGDFSQQTAPQNANFPPQNIAYPIEKKSELVMPEHAENMRRVFAYLCQTRKIPGEIVSELAHAGLLYQSQNEVNCEINGVPQTFKNNNAVFVHKDENGRVIGGEVQGINTYKRYKGIAEGTGESAFLFTPVPAKNGEIKKAYLFESAIDLMSFYSFCADKKKLEGAVLVSMGGLKPSVPKRLEAQGAAIFSCVDNDDAGRKFEADNGFKRGTNLLEKEGVKDWNDLLLKRFDGAMSQKANALETEKKSVFSFGRNKKD
jgi:hypothetical protein